MTNDADWNDVARLSLRKRLRSVILGELRLARSQHDDILASCRAVYIDEQCPENESGAFVQYATDELSRAAAQLESEKATWPQETDCDRLDRVELALRDRDIMLWQVSPCCDSCTISELPDRAELIDDRDAGFRQRVRGFAFFIDQTMPEALAESSQLLVCLGYGWISPDRKDVAPDVYEPNALGIAREVCECLREFGFEPDWDGDFARKICISINWQRRTLLE